ncbi:MAG TPA: phage holin family protein [Opitutaceae bacterium]|jgi:putative membrane protein|nr:phage holin family protein [Opitutaceae bacterium]
MNHSFGNLLVRWGVLALGVALAAHIVRGISYDDFTTLVVVVLLLSFFNLFLKPLLVLFTLPFIVLTMGLGLIVINALLFLFVGWLVKGFQVDGFWSALGGACVVSVTNFVMSRVLRAPTQPRPTPKRDDVIDI